MNTKPTNITTFNHHLFGEIRIADHKGNPWFIAKDVASSLGYTNPQKAIRDHCKGVNETFTPSKGGNQLTKIIPEFDVYRLVMRSKLPEAERFQDWVYEEVLPAIRKTGHYAQPATPSVGKTPLQILVAKMDQFQIHDSSDVETFGKMIDLYDHITGGPDTPAGNATHATHAPIKATQANGHEQALGFYRDCITKAPGKFLTATELLMAFEAYCDQIRETPCYTTTGTLSKALQRIDHTFAYRRKRKLFPDNSREIVYTNTCLSPRLINWPRDLLGCS